MNYLSHIGQDRWVAEVYGQKKSGYFFDAGGLDGVLTSNTYYLEKCLGWDGLVVEANPTNYPAVCKNRSCVTINAALWGTSHQVIEMVDAHGLSSMVDHADGDSMSKIRKEITLRTFSIETINPTDLLDRFISPCRFEYLSLDIEGAEIEFLKGFDFIKYKPGLMTIEHAEIQDRQAAIRSIVLPHGYEVISVFYDDWFWHPEVLASLGGKDAEAILKTVIETYPIGENPKSDV